MIDATHPFAAQMSAHAVAACAAASVPLAVLTRPPWRPEPGDRWREVGDAPRRRRALGRDAAACVPDRRPPQRRRLRAPRRSITTCCAPSTRREALPPDREVVRARPPFRLDDEIELMRSRRIDVLVSKNSGGEATRAKLDAARALALAVVMIRRPPAGGATVLYDVDAALAWIEAHRGAS